MFGRKNDEDANKFGRRVAKVTADNFFITILFLMLNFDKHQSGCNLRYNSVSNAYLGIHC